MTKMVRKGDLPTKTCPVCGRPFAWRRKWAKVWDEVRYCSDGCRRRAQAKDRDDSNTSIDTPNITEKTYIKD